MIRPLTPPPGGKNQRASPASQGQHTPNVSTPRRNPRDGTRRN